MFQKEIFLARFVSLKADRSIQSKDIALALKVSKAAISQLESGKNIPSLNTIIALADFFNVSIDYLVGRSDDPQRL